MSDEHQNGNGSNGNGEVHGRLVRPPAADGQRSAVKPFIATPAYGGMVTTTYMAGLTSLLRSLDASGIEHGVGVLWNESLVTRARNRLVAQFLKSDCTHLLFIDADVGFDARDVKPLLESGLEVVAGAYPMKAIGWQNVHAAAKAGKSAEELSVAGALYAVNPTAAGSNGASIRGLVRAGYKFIEVQDAATGFLCIRRDVIERFIDHYRSEIEYVADYPPNHGELHHMVFQAALDPLAVAQKMPARYLSEDYWFSRKWQMMGGKIHLCLGTRLTHTGTFAFEGGGVGELFVQAPRGNANAEQHPAQGLEAE